MGVGVRSSTKAKLGSESSMMRIYDNKNTLTLYKIFWAKRGFEYSLTLSCSSEALLWVQKME